MRQEHEDEERLSEEEESEEGCSNQSDLNQSPQTTGTAPQRMLDYELKVFFRGAKMYIWRFSKHLRNT